MTEYSSGRIRKNLARGKWTAAIRYRDEGGPWRTKTKLLPVPCYEDSNRGERKAQEAFEQWRGEFMQQHEKEQCILIKHAAGYAATVGEAVANHIEGKQTLGLEASTIASYRRYEGYITQGAKQSPGAAHGIPATRLGSIPLEELTRAQVQSWVNGLAAHLAPVTVEHVLRLLHAALEDARRDGLISENPAEWVSKPRRERTKKNDLPPAEQARLLDELDAHLARDPGDAVRAAIKTALLTGMRQQELCALQWGDVELDPCEGLPCTLTVKHALGRAREGGARGDYYVKEPKSHRSRRRIPLTEGAALTLRRLRTAVRGACLRAGVPFSPHLFVFGTIDGRFLIPDTLRQKWSRIADRLELKGSEGTRPTFHDLRHTFATALVSSGADIKSAQALLGHANASTTLDIYAGVDERASVRSIRAVGEHFDALEQRPPADVVRLRTGTED